MKRLLSICLATLLALGLSVVALLAQPAMADPGDIYVPGDYPAIQQGINAATSGDTVHVAAGTYYEHITIDKPLILLGEDRETTIIDGGGTGNVVYVTADHVEISGFTVQNSGSAHFQFHYWWRGESGIFLGESSYSKITDCDVRNGGHGISLQYHSDYNLVENCNAYSNTWNGIFLGLWSSHSVIINCNVWNNNSEGIGLWDWGENNTISNCNAYSNTVNGIGIHWHPNTVVENCNAWNNGYAGIGFDSTMYCKVENANSYSNYIGVLIYTWGSTRYNTITGCDIYSNTYGILVYDPAGHPYGGNNMIYHNNVIDNTYQAKDGNSYPNTWDDGYPSGGNYWSDYVGVDLYSGPNQDEPGKDGIGDEPYNVVGLAGSQDRYPFMRESGWAIIQVEVDIQPGSDPNSINPDRKGVIPVAVLTTNTAVGESVTFDATTVDAETVHFGPDGAQAVHWGLEDVDSDGDIDMVLHFKTQETGIQAGDTEATLTGRTLEEYGAQDITGTDSVRTVPPKGKGK